MEDLVAVEVMTASGAAGYVVTWGRIQHNVDPEPLEQPIMEVASRFALPGEAVSARLCDSLHDARDAKYFYEALFRFSQKSIPYSPGYDKWRRLIES